MAISWGTIKSLLLFFGPILLPRALSYYRSIRTGSTTARGVAVRAPTPAIARALLILFAAATGFLLKTLPTFAPENIFTLTSSRLQTPTDVLFARLAGVRSTGALTPADELLRAKMSSLEARLLLLLHGPAVLRECLFCSAEDPRSYMYYALPGLLAPHLLNLCVLAVVTSGLVTGREGAVWRTPATLVSGALALLELYVVGSYNYQANARATRLEEIEFFFWNMRIYRGILLAAVDGAFGWLLYLSATNRAFVTPPATAERLETSTRLVEGVRGKMSAMGIVRNAINRDDELRNMSQRYWVHEGKVLGELMEEKEVVDGVRNALENRINMQTISADAEAYAQNVVGSLQAMPT